MLENKDVNAALYIRVSTEKQVQEGYSVLAQKDTLSTFAIQQDWNIFDIYADEGFSGKNIEDRPEVKRLIHDIKNKKIDVVLLYKFDRLTRDSRDTEEIISLIQQFDIQLFTLGGGTVDVSTATGRFAIRINGAVAQLEREQTVERIRFALKQKVKQGYTLACATTCYGYDRHIHEKNQIINYKEAKVVKKIFEMYADDYSLTEICNILNAKNIAPKKRGKVVKEKSNNHLHIINSIWMPKTIKSLLSNPTYIGKVRYHIGKPDELVTKGNHKPIISQKLWNKVQLKLCQTQKKHRTKLPKSDVYYSGTLYCGICGQKLTPKRTVRIKKDGTKVTFNGYRCSNKELKKCNSHSVSHLKVEKTFINYLDNISSLNEINKIELFHNRDSNKEQKKLKTYLSQTKSKQRQINNLFINNEINIENFQYMNNQLNKKITDLENSIDKIKNDSSININNDYSLKIKDHWKYLTDAEKLKFLNLFVESISIINNFDKNTNQLQPKILNIKFYDK